MELQRRNDREDTMKAFETLGATIDTNMNRIDSFVVDTQLTGTNLHCHYNNLTKSIEDIATDGATDYAFRAEFNGFCATIANVFYDTLQQNTANAAASLIKDALNVDVHFARAMVRWSSLCTRTLLQGCLVLRVREWICQERGLTYPNDAIKREIQHSTYLNLRCYFSLISHLDRVWDERNYDGSIVLRQMTCALLSKFGADLLVFHIDQKIDYHYGARKAVPSEMNTPQIAIESDETRFTTFLKSIIDKNVSNYLGLSFLWDRYTEQGLPAITARSAFVRRVNSVNITNVTLTRSPKYGQIQGWNVVRPKTNFQKFLDSAFLHKRYILVSTLWNLYQHNAPSPEPPIISSERALIKFVNIAANDVGIYPVKDHMKTVGWNRYRD